MPRIDSIVLIHGWGLNSAIWHDYRRVLERRLVGVNIVTLDLPGYGTRSEMASSSDLISLAQDCLERAPEHAVWVGWSLGGLITMQAALIDKRQQIQAIQLLNSTPRFTQAEDWPCGVDMQTFWSFGRALGADYEKTLAQFLLLQAGQNRGARTLARSAQESVCRLPAPSPATLNDGLACLENSDLRKQLNAINVPTQVVCGIRDRVTDPRSSVYLAEQLQADLVELDCGHAPFLTRRDETAASLTAFVASLEPLLERCE